MRVCVCVCQKRRRELTRPIHAGARRAPRRLPITLGFPPPARDARRAHAPPLTTRLGFRFLFRRFRRRGRIWFIGHDGFVRAGFSGCMSSCSACSAVAAEADYYFTAGGAPGGPRRRSAVVGRAQRCAISFSAALVGIHRMWGISDCLGCAGLCGACGKEMFVARRFPRAGCCYLSRYRTRNGVQLGWDSLTLAEQLCQGRASFLGVCYPVTGVRGAMDGMYTPVYSSIFLSE